MNPIAAREFFGILRQPRSVAAMVTLALAFALIVLAKWPAEGMADLSGNQSRQVLRIFAYGLLGGVMLLVPAFPATSIVKEKRRGTLALLLNSPMTSVSIYVGKLTGVLAFSALLLLTSLPAGAACYAMGGVDLWNQLLALYLTYAMLTVEFAALALLVSTLAPSPDAALRLTYALVFALCFAALGPYYLLQGKPGLLGDGAYWLRRLSPVPVVMQLIGHAGAGARGLTESGLALREFLIASATLTIGLIAATISQLNHRLFDRARPQGTITDDQSFAFRGFRRLMFLVDPQRRKSGISFFLNPVMVKEFRTRRFGRVHWLMRLVAICAVISLLLTFAATTGTMDWGVETIGGLMVLLQVILVVLITPSLAAGLVSSEQEGGGWDLLRMTTLSPWRIVIGKLSSVVWTLLLVLMATVPGYLVMIYIKPTMWLQVYLVIICLLWTAVYTLTISAAVGCWFNKTATSTVTAYVVLMGLFLGPLIVWVGRDAPFGYATVQAALAINPMGAALSVIQMPGFAEYELIPGSWWLAGIVSVLALAILAQRVWHLSRPS